MSAIGQALRTKLLTYPAVTALIGDRLTPDALLQNTEIPAVIYYCISTQRDHHLSGLGKSAHARFTFEVISKFRNVSQSISKAIRETGIDSFRGVVDGYTFCGIDFDSGDEYMQEPPTDGGQEHRYLVSFDLLVHYKEP